MATNVPKKTGGHYECNGMIIQDKIGQESAG
jgi:hypothetical protein